MEYMGKSLYNLWLCQGICRRAAAQIGKCFARKRGAAGTPRRS